MLLHTCLVLTNNIRFRNSNELEKMMDVAIVNKDEIFCYHIRDVYYIFKTEFCQTRKLGPKSLKLALKVGMYRMIIQNYLQ